MRKKVNCEEGWSQTQGPFSSLKYQLWPEIATDSQSTDWLCQLSNLLAHAEFFNFLFFVDIVWKDPGDLVRIWMLLTSQQKKRNNKVNQAEKGAPADFSIWANVTRVNAPMGLI